MKKWMLLLFLPFTALAQQPEMADTLRSEGKIYVVIAVIAIIFLGIAVYLFWLDSRLKKVEKK